MSTAERLAAARLAVKTAELILARAALAQSQKK